MGGQSDVRIGHDYRLTTFESVDDEAPMYVVQIDNRTLNVPAGGGPSRALGEAGGPGGAAVVTAGAEPLTSRNVASVKNGIFGRCGGCGLVEWLPTGERTS